MKNHEIENKLSKMISDLTPIHRRMSGRTDSYEAGTWGDAADLIIKAQFYLQAAVIKIGTAPEDLEEPSDPKVEHATSPVWWVS